MNNDGANGAVELRAWLARVLSSGGSIGHLIPGPFVDAEAALAAAAEEQVVGLVAERMKSLPETNAWRQLFLRRSRELAVMSLRRDEECRRVLAALHAQDLSPLLLKGVALGHWLYPSPWLRETLDVDLLFPSARDAQRAADVLRANGYAGGQYFGNEALETACTLPGVLQFDIHWGIVNSPLFSRVLSFDEWQERAIALPSLSGFARGLSPMHAVLHACMHRVINLHMGTGDKLKWLFDLHLMLPRLSGLEWQELTALCETRGLSGVCLDAFEAVAATFGTEVPDNALETLERAGVNESLDRKRFRDWSYIQKQTLLGFPTQWERLQWLFRRAFPSLAYLRSVYGEDLGTVGLIKERARRLLLRTR